MPPSPRTARPRSTLLLESPTMPPPIQETVRVHFRRLVEPVTFTLDERFNAMRDLFAAHGIGVELGSSLPLSLPQFEHLDVDECPCGGRPSRHQERLFAHRDNVPVDDVCIYFVRSVDGNNGCSTHPRDLPGAVVAFDAPLWTLAHEVGHVLGRCHVNDSTRLMHRSTSKISVPTPRLHDDDVSGMLAHTLTR